jgi:hypothetical protein
MTIAGKQGCGQHSLPMMGGQRPAAQKACQTTVFVCITGKSNSGWLNCKRGYLNFIQLSAVSGVM